MNNLNILVTGGAGFVGTNLIKKLLKCGHKVTSIDNYSTGDYTNHVDRCNYLYGDITDKEIIDTLPSDIDVVFHMAAIARIQPSLKNPAFTIENNFNGTLNILEYARENDIQVIYAGSSSMHHGLYGSPYAWSKFGGEELCKVYSSVYDLNTSICRFYNVYGPHQLKTGTYATVIGIFLYQCIGKDFRAEFFELGRGVNYSINELAALWGGYPTEYIDARPGEYPWTLCEDKNAREKLGWVPFRNLDDYIKTQL